MRHYFIYLKNEAVYKCSPLPRGGIKGGSTACTKQKMMQWKECRIFVARAPSVAYGASSLPEGGLQNTLPHFKLDAVCL